MAKARETDDRYMHLPATGHRAKEIGETLYFTGRRCTRGHLCPRYASSGNCVDCITQKRGITHFNHRGRSSKRSAENQARAEAALADGVTTYEASSPCPHGHLTRFVTTNNCVTCGKINDEKRKKNAKWRRLEKLYGLTRQMFEEMLKAQAHCCAICGSQISASKSHVDHCHTGGHVRGLLCSRCNQAIGLFDENPKTMLSAIQYLGGEK